MANASKILEWCIVRLGEDHNWWVEEVSDPIRWDVDGLSIVDPRQAAHLIELVDPLRDYGFDQDIFESAFIPFRIEKEAGDGKIRLKRVKDSILETEEKLFCLPDIVDEENGPYADLLDHLTRCRVKMLNDLFEFENKLSLDEVEDEIREEQNASFMEGKAIHSFDELCAILDYMPAGYDADDDEERGPKSEIEEEGDDIPDIEDTDEDEEALKGDTSLKWDEDEEEEEGEGADENGEKPKPDEDDDDFNFEDEEEEEEEDEDEEEEDDDRPARRGGKAAAKSAKAAKPSKSAKAASKPAKAAKPAAKAKAPEKPAKPAAKTKTPEKASKPAAKAPAKAPAKDAKKGKK